MSCEEPVSPEEFDAWMASERERRMREWAEWGRIMTEQNQPHQGPDEAHTSWGYVRYRHRSSQETGDRLRAYGIKP